MTTVSVPRAAGPHSAASPVDERPIAPVKVWAFLGAVIVAFEIYVWVGWIAGPYFKTVPAGPTPLPGWMKVVCLIFQILGPIGIVALFWFVLIRPWRRNGRVTFDGLLISALFFVSCQDPLSSYFENWYTYNSYMLNWGAWNKSFPGWMSFAEPGRMASEPILFTIPAYIYYLFGLSVIGCIVMRRVKARWGLGLLGQVAGCWLSLAFCALVVEGLIWFPLGILTYPGGVGPKLFPSTYHTFPLHESVFIGAISTGLALLRFHVNDRGEIVAERGIGRLRLGAGKEVALRFLAVAGVANLLFFGLYNVPVAIIVAHGSAWPKDEQRRSYLTNFICGAGTDRLCPDPQLPLARSSGIYINAAGKVVVPRGMKLPRQVPFGH
ncbi:MAG: spirocyclase AveC family protein [Solirubrobacteraceae bacterium]